MAAKAKLKKVSAKIKTPFLDVQGDWEADESDQQAAWELYIELVTRIAVQELNPAEGSVREALTSLHDIFGETRHILKKYGPTVAQPKGGGSLSLGSIAVQVLNMALRPFLTKWHPLLSAYENTRSHVESPLEHEAKWEKNSELRDELSQLNQSLREYSNLLAAAAGIPSVI